MSHVSGHADGTVTLADQSETSLVSANGGKLISSSVSPKEAKVLTVLVPITGPGLYCLEVRVPGSPEEAADSRAIHDRVSKGVAGEIAWSSITFVEVLDEGSATTVASQGAAADTPPLDPTNP